MNKKEFKVWGKVEAPTECLCCGAICDYRDIVVDKIEHMTTELERHCNQCEEVMGYWFYGSWVSED